MRARIIFSPSKGDWNYCADSHAGKVMLANLWRIVVLYLFRRVRTVSSISPIDENGLYMVGASCWDGSKNWGLNGEGSLKEFIADCRFDSDGSSDRSGKGMSKLISCEKSPILNFKGLGVANMNASEGEGQKFTIGDELTAKSVSGSWFVWFIGYNVKENSTTLLDTQTHHVYIELRSGISITSLSQAHFRPFHWISPYNC